MSRFAKNGITLIVLVFVIVGGIVLVTNMRAHAGTGSGETSQVSVPVKNATNVETVKVDGGNDMLFFDVERDGVMLTCTTKPGFNSGVTCFKK